ncbi:MAG: flagellar basal body rod protein FlgB [Calditrichia bacterium]
MIKNFILNKTAIPALSKGLDVYALRHKAIAANIANVQTEGYRRQEVKFEDQLQHAIKSRLAGTITNEKHLSIGKQDLGDAKPQLVEDNAPELSGGINNVDIDREIIDQVKNEIRFLYGARLISKNFAALRACIKGRFDQ